VSTEKAIKSGWQHTTHRLVLRSHAPMAPKPARKRRRHKRVPAKQMRFPFVAKECRVEGEFKICDGYNDAVQVSFEPRDGSEDATLSARKYGTYKGKPRWKVGGAYVPYPMLDKGIGTRLYEKMMEAVRKRGGVFTSSDTRSVFSEAFWKKQYRKRRAECGDWDNPASYYSNPLNALEEACEYGYGDGETIPKEVCKRLLDVERPDDEGEGWPCGFWALKLPMPDTLGKLSGLRKKKRRRR